MTFDVTRQIAILRRYQLMFRTAVGAGTLGLLLLVVGVIAWMVGPPPVLIPWGLLLLGLSSALALKVAQSTARILEGGGLFRRCC